MGKGPPPPPITLLFSPLLIKKAPWVLSFSKVPSGAFRFVCTRFPFENAWIISSLHWRSTMRGSEEVNRTLLRPAFLPSSFPSYRAQSKSLLSSTGWLLPFLAQLTGLIMSVLAEPLRPPVLCLCSLHFPMVLSSSLLSCSCRKEVKTKIKEERYCNKDGMK